VILRAPAFIYPRRIWGLRQPGCYLGRKAGTFDSLFMPEFSNYMLSGSGRRLRWMELAPVGAAIDSSPLDTEPFYQYFPGEVTPSGGVYDRLADVSCASYAGVRKPSFISFVIPLKVESGETAWNIDFEHAQVLTDMLIYPFAGPPRELMTEEKMAMTFSPYEVSLDSAACLTMAVGTWAQLQVYKMTNVGALSRFLVNLVTERQVRCYGDKIDNLGGTPVLSISGGGQTFPVAVRGPSDTDLSASAGGIIFNGGSPQFYILTGRSSIASDTTLTIRADFEVPYDI